MQSFTEPWVRLCFPDRTTKCVSVHKVSTPTIPDPGSYIHISENVTTRAVFFSSGCWRLPPSSSWYLTPALDCHLWVLSERFFTCTARSLPVFRHHLTSHYLLYTCHQQRTHADPEELPPCLHVSAHISWLLRQQKGTEASATLIIGHMMDIKYNHTFTT